MTLPLSERFRDVLREIRASASSRHQAFGTCEEGYAQRKQAIEEGFQQGKSALESGFLQTKADLEQEWRNTRAQLEEHFKNEQSRLDQEWASAKRQAEGQLEESREKAEEQYKENRWAIVTQNEADKKVSRDQLQQAQRAIKYSRDQLRKTHREAKELIMSWDFVYDFDVEIDPDRPVPDHDPVNGLQNFIREGANILAALKAMRAPVLLNGFLPYLLTGLAWLAAVAVGFFTPFPVYWILGASAVVPLIGWLVKFIFVRRTSQKIADAWETLCQVVIDCKKLRKVYYIASRKEYKRQRLESRAVHLAEIRKLLAQYRRHVQSLERRRDMQIQQADAKYPPLKKQTAAERETQLKAADQEARAKFAKLQEGAVQQRNALVLKAKQDLAENEQRHQREWTALATAWKQSADRFNQVFREVADETWRAYPPWNAPFWKEWKASRELPLGLPFGKLDVQTARIPHAEPENDRLTKLQIDGIDFPALLPFPERASILFRAYDTGRDQAISTLQAVLLRAWTGLPAGKMRCTIIDPVGRGENFSSFMHLADQEEALVTSRIWTESSDIDERLSDLTMHMETVLQKFLRNQFQTLAEYNAQADEVAEPFRFLVVANFPVNFSTEAARRLISIASSGSRCGIYTLVMVDTRQPLPQGIDVNDLEAVCTTLDWNGEQFLLKDAEWADFPLTLERQPSPEFCTTILRQVGEAAKKANRVEVPFQMIAPPEHEYWTTDSRSGIQVPMGRSGAIGRQFLSLGKGTSQHVLIAGKTGSGKSTLLHVIITQLALRYSPNEVEMYLIDFKKGVEFKTYAHNRLPHARVVAVESEREFGLSVLQRLDAELVRRGETFRQLGVNDLPSYRNLADTRKNSPDPLPPMPRMLLLVDEFQEFFVEDDKVAQEAGLLIDRLVRQGRSFGIHLVFGSQTLGGAYSMARTTIDQMAVRIALQCSEADAHLILSKDNSEARLLSRPGEAIYNSANGLPEGNNLFQIVWLNDNHRDDYLKQMRELAVHQQYRPAVPAVIFEGMAPSELSNNPFLRRLREGGKTPTPGLYGWLGEAIAIKDPTAAVFRRQSGNNLIIIGQNADAAFRMNVSMLASLALQKKEPARDNLFLLVGAQLEEEQEAVYNRLADVLPIQVVQQRDLTQSLVSLSEELDRRQKGQGDGEDQFLFVYGLQRVRDLRKAEDDFGSRRSSADAPPNPAKLFANLCREGPPLGIHVIVWVDNLTNLQRSIDRQGMREFEMRILFQMSAADSSNLMDTPVASKLGNHRALYYTEEQGKLEKFRPYGLPTIEFLESLGLKPTPVAV